MSRLGWRGRGRGSREPRIIDGIQKPVTHCGGTGSGGMRMMKQLLAVTAAVALSAPALAQAPNDAQIAHIAYTAGQIDVAAARQALQRSHNRAVRAFAQTMIRDHVAV